MGNIRWVTMAKSFLICKVRRFYEENYFLPAFAEGTFEYEGEAEIKIEKTNINILNNYVTYICHHDLKVSVFGKVYNKTFAERKNRCFDFACGGFHFISNYKGSQTCSTFN